MKLVVAGKGGVGKTTVSGTIARAFARSGRSVLALDADLNPMLGISLGIGPERTDELHTLRQGLDSGDVEHQPTLDGMIESFGTDAPDGVRLVVLSKINHADPGCTCCGVGLEQLLGELEGNGRVTVYDCEAGVALLPRLEPARADCVLLVTDPGAKSIDVARRALELVPDGTAVMVVANRVRDDADLAAIRALAGDHPMAVIPEDDAITRAEQAGDAPIDVDPDAPAVRALVGLADQLAGNGHAP